MQAKRGKRRIVQQRTKVLSGPGDKVFSAFLGVFTVFLIVVTVYPLIYVFSMAISDPVAVSRKEVWLFPVGFSS